MFNFMEAMMLKKKEIILFCFTRLILLVRCVSYLQLLSDDNI